MPGGSRCDRRDMTDSPHPVLVGIDGTASGLEALALGSAFAVLTGSPLVLAAVYGHGGYVVDYGLVYPPQEEAERWIEEAQQRLGDFIPFSTRVILSSSPAHGLVDLAGLEGARMIVLGSNHHGPLGRVLAGSTGRRVAHGAPCAVAIAPHDWRTQPPDVPLTFGVAVSETDESRDALALAATFADAAHAPLKLFNAVHVPPPAHPMYAATGTSYEHWRRDCLAGRSPHRGGCDQGCRSRSRARDRGPRRRPCREPGDRLARPRRPRGRVAALRTTPQRAARRRVLAADRTCRLPGRDRPPRGARCKSPTSATAQDWPCTPDRLTPDSQASAAMQTARPASTAPFVTRPMGESACDPSAPCRRRCRRMTHSSGRRTTASGDAPHARAELMEHDQRPRSRPSAPTAAGSRSPRQGSSRS